MAFDKKTGSEAGKKSSRKDSPNKTTEEIRLLFKDLVQNNIDKLQKDLDALEPHQRIKSILEISKFVIPVLRSSELKADVNLSSNYTPIWGKIDPILDDK